MLKNEIAIPKNVEVRIENSRIYVKGGTGEVSREFKHPNVKIRMDNGNVILTSDLERKKTKAIMGTWKVLLNNMFLGVEKGWKSELKLVYSHFPVKLKLEEGKLVIENFLGERKPRTLSIPQDIKVDVDKNTVLVTGKDKERVGQTAARIEEITKVKGYDRRVFQDGCFITKKPYVSEEEDERGNA
ncbi:MAG: 50S ribosomal protein L6 [Candidatus Aenigmarchaeota archaeon]|nr:50S ribosomal protein L6 [Candidatus Aenigmarchaeota archaeon]NIQ17295.1 50S ribosomal protein L6 [Candidatus Aenigmarchaeota archaeon]NIS73156.1 50S ribosomal protein L6 [Candidatus Aenigmarchaeota archaeon]